MKFLYKWLLQLKKLKLKRSKILWNPLKWNQSRERHWADLRLAAILDHTKSLHVNIQCVHLLLAKPMLCNTKINSLQLLWFLLINNCFKFTEYISQIYFFSIQVGVLLDYFIADVTSEEVNEIVNMFNK